MVSGTSAGMGRYARNTVPGSKSALIFENDPIMIASGNAIPHPMRNPKTTRIILATILRLSSASNQTAWNVAGEITSSGDGKMRGDIILLSGEPVVQNCHIVSIIRIGMVPRIILDRLFTVSRMTSHCDLDFNLSADILPLDVMNVTMFRLTR
jgi:hypothetical protein